MEGHSDIRPQEERSILINFVLDKSGSMEAIREATIAGFNEFLRDQQEEGGSAAMTLTLFDTRFKTVVSALPISQVRPLDHRHYLPGGGTALYDAIAHTMRVTDDYVAECKPDQVLFVIMTDGQENSSREFGREQIMELIENRQLTADYEFIYLGANQDSYQAGRSMGIAAGRMLDYDHSPAATRATMEKLSWNVKAHRRSGEKQRSGAELFSAEFEERGKSSYAEHKEKLDREAGAGGAGGAGTGGADHGSREVR